MGRDMERVRIGIVGGGGIVRGRHMPGFAAIDGVDVVAVCNSTRVSSERFAAEFDVPAIFDDWRDLVSSPDIDAVVIGTWPYLHHPITLAALEAGKHVFTQARMAMRAQEAAEMLAASEKSDRVCMICPAPIGIHGDRLMQQLIAEGYLGEVYAIHARHLTPEWLNPEKEFHWRLDAGLSGVNTLTVGLYAEWVHRWFGETRRISAEIKHCITQRRDPATGEMRHVDTPDIVLAHGRMASGAVVNYEFGGVYRGAGERFIQAFGSEGTLKYIVGKDEIVGAQGDDDMKVIAVPDHLVRPWDVEEIWIRGIREGTPVSPSFTEGLMYMDLTEAVYHSARLGRVIELPLADQLRETPVYRNEE